MVTAFLKETQLVEFLCTVSSEGFSADWLQRTELQQRWAMHIGTVTSYLQNIGKPAVLQGLAGKEALLLTSFALGLLVPSTPVIFTRCSVTASIAAAKLLPFSSVVTGQPDALAGTFCSQQTPSKEHYNCAWVTSLNSMSAALFSLHAFAKIVFFFICTLQPNTNIILMKILF